MPNVDFPIFSLPSKYVVAGKPNNSLYASFLHKSSVNQDYIVHKAGNRDAVIDSGLQQALAADIEANYKSLAYPSVLPIWKSDFGVKNAELLFVGTSAGTAGEVVVVKAVTAATAVLSVAVSSQTATITISDTASNNTANAVVTAWNATTAATAKAAISLYLGTQDDGTSRNDGTGLVPAFGNQQLLQANTYQTFGKIRYVFANISTERG